MYTFTEQFGVAVVPLNGEINMQNAMNLRNWIVENLLKKGKVKIVFDLSNVTSIDSFGLGTFVSLHKSSLTSKGGIAFVNSNENVKKLLSMTALDKVIKNFNSITEAVNVLK